MTRRSIPIAALLFAIGCPGSTDTDTDVPTPETYEATWTGVQEMMVDHCDECHPAQNGIDLRALVEDDLATEGGAYVVAGDAEGSFLWQAVGGSTLSAMMPPSGRLPDVSVEHVRVWIDAGAPLP